jgi:hypothetical protein
VVGVLDINGRAASNAADLSSRDGNSRVPELLGTADALDINGEVEGHGCHVRPARPLRHSTHCPPAFGGDEYGHAPELSGTVEAAGALDINGRATGNTTAYGVGMRTTVRMSSPGQSKRQAHLTSMAE